MKLTGATLGAIIWTSLAASAADLLTIEYDHALRVEHRCVKVTVGSSGSLKLSVAASGTEKETRSTISGAELAELKRRLDSIDWRKVAEDRVTGLDGSTVRITHQGNVITLWTPEFDTRKRGLIMTRKLIHEVFSLAGLDEKDLS